MVIADMSIAGIRERMVLECRMALETQARVPKVRLARMSGKSWDWTDLVRNLDLQAQAIKAETWNAWMCAYRHAEKRLEDLQREGYEGHVAYEIDYARDLVRFEVVIDRIPEGIREILEGYDDRQKKADGHSD